MKVDFKVVKIYNIEGKLIEKSNLHKTIADILYCRARNLTLVEIAKKIHKGEVVDLSHTEVEEIKQLISSPNDGLLSFARKAVLEYIDSIGKEEKK